ncbi:PREDICTED: protein TBRG4 [Gekko japonicus]|uniref:FAST kinase domain-containing protein 4 n=1 Tax=Gekko japonicus TaxID=146911 RepID=A0ABM1KS02_GEKJA|nr:PREDICTED: protein TBRG4 [Gekko japonicus]
MAAKLMQRCYRLFGVSSPLCIRTNAMCVGSKRVLSRAPSQIPLASLSFTERTDKLSVPEPEYRAPSNREEMEGLIGSAATTEDLLHLRELHPVNANQAALIITRLSRMVAEQKLEPGSILEDARFHQLLQLVHTEKPNSHFLNDPVIAMQMSSAASPLYKQALELAEQFSPEDTRRIVTALAFQNRRSVSLLRALSYHLVQKHFTLSTNLLLDVAFAFGKLNFHQTQVFQKIALDLHPRVAEMAHGDVVRCLKSFAFLKWLNLPLFEAFAQYTVDNGNKFSPASLSNVVLAFARLNFQPSCAEAFFGTIHERLEDHLDSLDPYLLVDLVWSLCVLQQAKALHLRKVLAPEFRTRFLGDQSPKGHNYRLKMIHINSAACLERAGYDGPLLPREALGLQELQGERKTTPLQSSLKETLKSIAGEEKARFEVATVFGWQLDAEMVLNADNQALPIADFDAPHLLQPTGSKPLPPGARRLAFVRWEFPNFSSRSKDLLGRFAMARRHLQLAGFLLVDVPYYEWLDLKSEWQRTAFLRDRMNKAVAEDMAK